MAHELCEDLPARPIPYVGVARWCKRNEERGDVLERAFADAKLLADRGTSARVARWAYSQIEAVPGLLWVRDDELVTLDVGWRALPGIAT